MADNTTNKIKIVSTNLIPEALNIDARLKSLIVSFEGQLPGSRDFGLGRRFLSRPSREAINIFAIELERKVAKYIPEITVQDVSGKIDIDGKLDLTIFVERSRRT